ncbi:MAG: YggT family protein [Chloroflexi bacterium]|nr:MAG: YggT family protein [Chloroflexota bacterium]TMF21650.1 MAG: YggT family protein [Chloroflexota bacterium]TMF99222.1 MAG: YggT family protein [Chloroflexota bacterium]
MTGPIDLLVFVIQAFLIIVLIRVVFSFVSPFPTNPISRFAWRVTEPVLAPIRRLLPPMSGLDLSPLVVWLVAIVLIQFLGSLH